MTIDLALVEDGIEIGKRMMAEMMATYSKGKTRQPSAGPGSGGSLAGGRGAADLDARTGAR